MAATKFNVNFVPEATGDTGTIDPKTSQDYARDSRGHCSTNEFSLIKTYENIRWKMLLRSVSTLGNIYFDKIEVGGGPDARPTFIKFNMTVEHGIESIQTFDEFNEGEILKGVDAIVRAMARVAVRETTQNAFVYQPETVGLDNMHATLHVGPAGTIEDWESAITVVAV